MGTHPIFESDFDCLTEGDWAANALNVKRILTTTIWWSITLVIGGGGCGDSDGNASVSSDHTPDRSGPIRSLCAVSDKRRPNDAPCNDASDAANAASSSSGRHVRNGAKRPDDDGEPGPDWQCRASSRINHFLHTPWVWVKVKRVKTASGVITHTQNIKDRFAVTENPLFTTPHSLFCFYFTFYRFPLIRLTTRWLLI